MCWGPWRDEVGATAITTALVLTTLIGFTGLEAEVGLWYGERLDANRKRRRGPPRGLQNL
jgi:Flp pilus assembly protein TadG